MLYTRAFSLYYSVFNVREHIKLVEICGDYSEEVTPVPIPNTEVKLLCADDTWRATAWESKTLPLILVLWSSG